jgi:nitric oxide reductase
VQSGDRDRLDDNEADPEPFDIHRKRDLKNVLAFGYGPHRRQAEAFSRIELEIAFTTLFERLPNRRLAEDVYKLGYPPAEQDAGVLSLPVLF